MGNQFEAKVGPKSEGPQMYPSLQADRIQQPAGTRVMGNDNPAFGNIRLERKTEKWTRRLRFILCCPASEPHKKPIEEAARTFGVLFQNPKLGFSEMFIGLRTLARYEEAQRKWILDNIKQDQGEIVDFLSGVPIKKETKFLDLSKSEDTHIINELEYYLNYSYAAFGYHLLSYDKPTEMWCCNPYLSQLSCFTSGDSECAESPQLEQQATGESNKSNHNPGRRPTIRGDNFLGMNMVGCQKLLDRYNCELIHASYESDIYVVPFIVAADHGKRTIVVAIRGSAQLHDIITDVNYQQDKLPIENCPDDWLGNRGNINAAVNVKTSLIGDQILDRAFKCRPDLGSQNYELVICGHSLGAATSAILGVLLRPLYPTLRAYLYSPPGGILSLPVVEYTKEFAVGIILGHDAVARAGLIQLERALYHIAWSSQEDEKRRQQKSTARSLCPWSCFTKDQVEYQPGQMIDFLFGLNEKPINYKDTIIPFQGDTQIFYPPGRLIHIIRNFSSDAKTRRLSDGPLYQAVWTDNKDYDRLLSHKKMWSDHFPWNLEEAIKKLRYGTLAGLPGTLK